MQVENYNAIEKFSKLTPKLYLKHRQNLYVIKEKSDIRHAVDFRTAI